MLKRISQSPWRDTYPLEKPKKRDKEMLMRLACPLVDGKAFKWAFNPGSSGSFVEGREKVEIT